jgi:hypothetical protein
MSVTAVPSILNKGILYWQDRQHTMDSRPASEDYESLLPGSEKTCHHTGKPYAFPDPSSYRRRNRILVALLSFSLLANFILGGLFVKTSPSPAVERTKYAGLTRNREEPFVMLTNYTSEDEELQNRLWHEINVDDAVVALSDDWAAEHGLRTSQRFPWDDTKGIYILHGFHNLHCLKIIHMSIAEYRKGEPQTRSWHHVSHCMDALRRQIICDADDTPRATERRPEIVSGLLQHRMCRSWDDLIAFSRKHTACYKRPDKPGADIESKVDRYKHCPPGTNYVIRDDYVPTDEIVTGFPEESLADLL